MEDDSKAPNRARQQAKAALAFGGAAAVVQLNGPDNDDDDTTDDEDAMDFEDDFQQLGDEFAANQARRKSRSLPNLAGELLAEGMSVCLHITRLGESSAL